MSVRAGHIHRPPYSAQWRATTSPRCRAPPPTRRHLSSILPLSPPRPPPAHGAHSRPAWPARRPPPPVRPIASERRLPAASPGHRAPPGAAARSSDPHHAPHHSTALALRVLVGAPSPAPRLPLLPVAPASLTPAVPCIKSGHRRPCLLRRGSGEIRHRLGSRAAKP